MDSGLTENQVRHATQIAELETRRYFDHYLATVFPQQQRALREHTHLMIERHNESGEAHGGVEGRVSKVMWLAAGAATFGAGGATGLSQLLAYFSG